MLLVLRPEPGLTATLDAARAMGLEAAGHALSKIVPVAWDAPDPATIDALLIGSANVFLHGGSALDALRTKPAYVVGRATADAARAAGFTVAAEGQGGLQKVLDAIAVPLRLLRIAGEEHLALDIPRRHSVSTVIAYRSIACPLDGALPVLTGKNIIAALHSAATARHFTMECERLGIDTLQITLAALGPRIAAAAAADWRAVHIAPTPDDAALLEMVHDLCD
ncbi:MAG: uroporphyrinogen-III synthase [Erythrobacter sp.]